LCYQFAKNGVNIVYDSIGNDYSEQNLEILGVDSRWVLYSVQSGAMGNISLGTILKKRIQMIGTSLRGRSHEYKTELVQQFQENVLNTNINFPMKSVIDKTFDFEKIADAHEYMEANKTMGKLIVKIL